jgi:hypothetical protein
MRKRAMNLIRILGVVWVATFAAAAPSASAGPTCQQRCAIELVTCNTPHPAPPPGFCYHLYQLCLAHCS